MDLNKNAFTEDAIEPSSPFIIVSDLVAAS
jgi:hypothetical protein